MLLPSTTVDVFSRTLLLKLALLMGLKLMVCIDQELRKTHLTRELNVLRVGLASLEIPS